MIRRNIDDDLSEEQGLIQEAEGIVSTGDVTRIWVHGFIERLASLPDDTFYQTYGACRTKLLAKFGVKIGVRRLDKAVEAERRKVAVLSDETVPKVEPAGPMAPVAELTAEELPADQLAVVEEARRIVRERRLFAVYSALLPRLAILGEPAWMHTRGLLYDGFGAKLDVRRLDARVEEERKKAKLAAELEEWSQLCDDSATAHQWLQFLLVLSLRYQGQGGWFTAREVAAAVRAGDIATIPDTLGDVDTRKEGHLERAIGRSLAKRLGMQPGSDGAMVRLKRRHNSHTDVFYWCVEVLPPAQDQTPAPAK